MAITKMMHMKVSSKTRIDIHLEEEFIQEKTERIIGVMKLLGQDAGNLAGCSTDVL